MNQTEYMKKSLSVLKKVFGYDQFRPGQEKIILAILSGQDLLAILPTGGGKSICYQIPALIFPGLTLVVSPLISLMKDQVDTLKNRGVPALYLNSSQSVAEQNEALHAAISGAVKLLYVSPERLASESFRRAAGRMRISLVCMDEAHAMVGWSKEFRPAYGMISDFTDSLPARPVIAAFTATASASIRNGILDLLRMKSPLVISCGFDRPNLFYDIRRSKDKKKDLFELLRCRRGEAGIIYCLTRRTTDVLSSQLQKSGIPCLTYHAGMTALKRQEQQMLWQKTPGALIVATNAFGMGIDKPDVRYVIHYNMPRSMEAYYQEAGRAGRDGLPSDAILLASHRDVAASRYFLSKIKNLQLLSEETEDLYKMMHLAGASSCIRQTLLAHFGEHAPSFCGRCSYCTGEGQFTHPKQYSEEEMRHLYTDLLDVRARLARENDVVENRILPDRVLRNLALRRPLTLSELLFIEHMNPVHAIKYGADFLAEIRAFDASRLV